MPAAGYAAADDLPAGDDEILSFAPIPESPPPEAEEEEPAAPAEAGVYQGKNPFSEDGSHSKFGTRGPDNSYQEGQFRPDQLSAFTILGEAFSLFGKNFVSFTIIAGVALLPAILFSLHTSSEISGYSLETGADPTPADIKRILTLLGMNVFFTFLCMPIATSAVTYGVGRELHRQKTTMIDCIQAGVRVLIPVLGVTVVQSLLVGVFAVLLFVGAFFALIKVLIALPCLGIIGLFIPLMVVAVFAAAFALTIPATVEERPGIFGALKTSWELTEGARVTIAFFYFALGFVGLVITMVLGFITGLMSEEAGELGLQVAQVMVTALNAAGVAVFYFRLRSAAERVPISELSSVA